jgi:DNA-binding Lrp family transcriptional regulator
MPTAYVLLNTEIGSKNQVLKSLREIDGVEEVYSLWGVYDIIANVTAESMEELKVIISERIEKVGKINSKLTMLVTEQTPFSIREQVLIEPEPLELVQ